MINVVLHLSLAFALLCGAILVQCSLIRGRSRANIEVIKDLKSLDGRLAQLSYHSIFSEGLSCSPDEVWSLIDGRRGLWAMFTNVGVLVAAAKAIEAVPDIAPDARKAAQHISRTGVRLRVTLLYRVVFASQSRSSGRIFSAAEEYVSFVSKISYVINDHFPELMTRYRYYFSSN